MNNSRSIYQPAILHILYGIALYRNLYYGTSCSQLTSSLAAINKMLEHTKRKRKKKSVDKKQNAGARNVQCGFVSLIVN